MMELKKYAHLYNITFELEKYHGNYRLEIAIEPWRHFDSKVIAQYLNLHEIAIDVYREWARHNRHRRFFIRGDDDFILWLNCPKELGEQVHAAIIAELNRVLPIITAEIKEIDEVRKRRWNP